MPLTEELVKPETLMRLAGYRIYDRGQQYYRQGRAKVESVDDDTAGCYVQGENDEYYVNIEVSGSRLLYDCNCPQGMRGVVCKHVVASLFALRDYLHVHGAVRWQTAVSRVISAAQSTAQTHKPLPYYLFTSLQNAAAWGESSSWRLVPYYLPFNALPDELRTVDPPLRSLPQSYLANLDTSVLRQPYNALQAAGCLNVVPLGFSAVNMLIDRQRTYYYYAPQVDLLPFFRGNGVAVYLGSQQNPLQHPLNVVAEPVQVRLTLKRVPEGVRLTAAFFAADECLPVRRGEAQVLYANPMWVLSGEHLFEIEQGAGNAWLRQFLETPEILIPVEEEAAFLEQYYLRLAERLPLEGDAVAWIDAPPAEPAPRLYLSDNSGELTATLRFAYGEHEVPYDPTGAPQTVHTLPGTWTLVRVNRKPDWEQGTWESISSTENGLKRAPSPAAPGTFALRAKIHPIDFLMRCVPRLAAAGFEIYGEEQLKTARVNRSKATISFNVSSGIDWFDVQAVVRYGDLEVALKDVRKAIKKKERFIKLADGTIGEIPEEWISHYRHLFALGQETEDGVRLSTHHITLLDQLLAESERVRADDEFQRRRQRLQDFGGITQHALPEQFTGELRPYQKAGVDWLHFLHEYEFGGCLADDMGLGKTVQVLVFLQSLRASSHPQHADLIVLPRSLLVNWQREAERFTPNLRLLEYHGNLRDKDTVIFDQCDLVVTTYGVMLRDIELLRAYRFHYVVLDESQAIKNPFSQSAKAARLLQGDHRLVMTGTPVENSTYELWSQFAFLNPGLLGSAEYFKEEFGTPIEKKGDQEAAQFLRKMVYPFILRRTKAQVAPELPPRTERIVYSDMDVAQRKLYNKTRDYYRGVLLGMLEKQGINDTRMKILEGLLRLRQICNHPRLVEQTFHGESAKFELLLETLETLRSEGHKALVFSQFVEMLKLVRGEMELRGIPYAYLDGRTQNRQERVDAFQNDPAIPFFLISLKAGGVGLNLTAADYVIHIDPWWNPAVEMQATDRTHRIGQDKPVFIYKLIARDTVEEKILQLQERKKALVEQLISTETSFFKSLTADDVKVLFS